jgi:hypothetical protein
MNIRLRKIEVDAETADLLEARAAALGMSVPALERDEFELNRFGIPKSADL